MKSLRQTQSIFKKKTDTSTGVEMPAFLGDLDGVVKADNFSNVYVTLFNGQVLTAKNRAVPKIPRLPVIVGRSEKEPTVFEVLRMQNVYNNPPYVDLPDHAELTHAEFGIDPVRVNGSQFYPGLAYPVAGTLTVQFYGYLYYLGGWHMLNNQQIDLSTYVPVSGAQYILAEVDRAKTISLRAGTLKSAPTLLTYEDIPAISVTKKSLFAVKLYQGQNQIVQTRTKKDIADLRWAGVSTGGISSVVDWADVINTPATYPPSQSVWDEINAIGEGHTHGTFRWVSAGGTTFELPDIASDLTAVFDNALRIDPAQVGLSTDGTQVLCNTAPTAGHVITADYILERI